MSEPARKWTSTYEVVAAGLPMAVAVPSARSDSVGGEGTASLHVKGYSTVDQERDCKVIRNNFYVMYCKAEL
jgi:hypothetical protein